jgi:RNA polymerase sigma factor (sigma-70 family)
MTSTQAGFVLQHIRRLTGMRRATQPPDAQLLERFLAQREEAAFADLVRRHGPMVLNVCRGILRHEQDAEDAFQATFLVLARKADTIRQPEAVAGWLYEVAHRVAVKAQADAARRRAQERKAIPIAAADPTLDITVREFQRVLHEELRRLPEKYRLPLVLCYLEGRSQEAGATQLGWSKGTFRGRLDRGREQLRRRLAARGVALSALLCATAVSSKAATEALVDSVARSAVRSTVGGTAAGALTPRVALLAEGVTRAMTTSKLKVTTAVLLAVGLVAAGAGVLAHQALAARERPVGGAEGEAGSREPEPLASEQPRSDAPAKPQDPLLREMNHQGFVRVVAFAPDGKTLLSGGDADRTVRLWDLATGKERVQMRTENQLTSMALSRDGTTAATGELDGTVRLWEATTGKPLATLKGHTASVFTLAFAPDNKTLASASLEHVVCVWEVASGKRLHQLRGPLPEVFSVAFAPDGRTLASGGRGPGGMIAFWDVATEKELPPLPGEQQEIWGLSFSPNGKFLAGACGRETPSLRLWDLTLRKEISRMGAPGEQTATTTFSPNGKLLASGRLNGDVCLWEVLTGKEIARVPAHASKGYGTYWVSFAPDGRTLASGGEDGFVRLWAVRGLGQGSAARKGELGAQELEALWDDLAAGDAAGAYQAVWELTAAPRQAVPLCHDRLLRPPAVKDPQLPQRLARLIADLDADVYEKREKATLELFKLGKAAEQEVRQALDNPASLEARRRLERVLAPLQAAGLSGDMLQALRAVEVLEQVGTPEAEEVLKKVAKEAAEVWLRQEAQATLDRLGRRPQVRP